MTLLTNLKCSIRMVRFVLWLRYNVLKKETRWVFTKGEDTHTLFSLRLGHARGKTTLSCFLTPSRHFATWRASSSIFGWGMRTPFCYSESHRGSFESLWLWQKIKDTHKECPYFLVAGVGFEPHDLRVMSPTSYQTAPSRDIIGAGSRGRTGTRN